MGRKKKGELPSGSIRIQKCIGRTPDGKRIMKSFTGIDRDAADSAYRAWLIAGDQPAKAEKKPSLSVSEAVRRYIDSKAAVLSPTTVRTYRGTLRDYIEGTELGDMDTGALTQTAVQVWVSDLAARVSPKTTRNASALLRSALDMFVPDFRYKVTLPQKIKPDLYCPSDQDVQRILKYIAAHDPELEKCVLLAAFGPLRRSEIAALCRSDIHGDTITVNKALVQNEAKDWVLKTTKTVSSTRTIQLPDFVIRKISAGDGIRIVNLNPNMISNRFRRAVRAAKGPRFRFHDLRAYSVSIMHAIHVPEKIILDRGGWATRSVMEKHYLRTISAEAAKQTNRINKHFMRVSHV